MQENEDMTGLRGRTQAFNKHEENVFAILINI